MPAATFDARGTVRSIGTFQVTGSLMSQRETTLGPGKSFRRRSSGGGRRVAPRRSQHELLADVMRQPALRYSSAPAEIPGRAIGASNGYAAVRDSLAFAGPGDGSLLDAVQHYHESGLASNMMLGRDLSDAQSASSSKLHGQSHIVSTRSRHGLEQQYGTSRRSSVGSRSSTPDLSSTTMLVPNDRGHAMSSMDRAPPPPWAVGLLAPTDEYSPKTRERRSPHDSGDPPSPTPERLELRARRSNRITLPPSESPKAATHGTWDVVRKAVRPLASRRVMARVSVKKGDGLAQPGLTHAKGPGRSTAVARKSLVQRWAYDAQAKLEHLETVPDSATEGEMEEITEQLAGALRAKVLPPGPLLRARRAHSRAAAWLDELRPPPPMPTKDFDMLRDLTKAVANLRMKGAVGTNRSSQEESLRKTFDELDEDGSGFLDHDEVAKLAEKLGRPMDADTLAKSIKLMDEDGDGVVDFPEFLAWWRFGLDGSAAQLSRPNSAGTLSTTGSGSWAGSRPNSAASTGGLM